MGSLSGYHRVLTHPSFASYQKPVPQPSVMKPSSGLKYKWLKLT
jgi:hypothetical protein